MIASPRKVIETSAQLVHAIHTANEEIPEYILKLGDDVERALSEYQWAVDYSQEKRTNYRTKGKRR